MNEHRNSFLTLYTLSPFRNMVYPAQAAENSYFSAEFRLKIFL